MDFSKWLYGFVKIDESISLSCYMDLSKLLHGFAKDVIWIAQSCCCCCISCPLPNKTNSKFDQDFKACWSFSLILRQCLFVIIIHPSIHFSGCTRRGKDQRGPKTWVPLHPRPLCGGYWKEAEGHQTCHHPHQNLTHIVSIISIQDTDWQKSWPWLIMKWSGGRESTKINGGFNLGKIGPGREKERGGNFALGKLSKTF